MLTEDEVVRSIANEIQRCTILQEVASLAVAEMVLRKLATMRGPCRLSIDAVLDVELERREKRADAGLRWLAQ